MNYFILSIFLFLTAGCARNESQDTRENITGHTAKVSMVQSVTAKGGTAAPDFTWIDEKGNTVHFSEYTKGKAVLLNFWATWCGPCKAELPDLASLSEEMKSKNAVVIGVSVDRDENVTRVVTSFVQNNHLPYTIVIDNGTLTEAFGDIQAIPTTFIVDAKGTIKKKLVGLQQKQIFMQELTAAMQ